jgi:hypothetical protein
MIIICIYQLCQDHRTENVLVHPSFVSIILMADLGASLEMLKPLWINHIPGTHPRAGGVYISCS